jgi:hypothetical protein
MPTFSIYKLIINAFYDLINMTGLLAHGVSVSGLCDG